MNLKYTYTNIDRHTDRQTHTCQVDNHVKQSGQGVMYLKYTHRHRPTDRQTDTHTQTDIQTDTHTHTCQVDNHVTQPGLIVMYLKYTHTWTDTETHRHTHTHTHTHIPVR